MDLKTNYSFSLAILAMAIFLSASHTKAKLSSETASLFCKTAENKTLCATLVKGATTWQAATANAVSETLKQAERAKPMLSDLKQALSRVGLSRITKESIANLCNEVYDFALECLGGALVDLKAGDRGRLDTKLSSVTGPSSECTNTLKKYSIASPLSNFFARLGEYASNSLSVARAI